MGAGGGDIKRARLWSDMRVRAIADLAQLSDDELFRTVSAGLRHILANALSLHRQAEVVGRVGHRQGSVILGGLAAEEAAKFHILLDAIRCARGDVFSRHLKKFYDHLARGIYAEHYWCYPANFAEVKSYVESARVALYLDGPDGFEWIFRNQIVERREQQIYVDYIQVEEAHQWVLPHRFLFFPSSFQPMILSVARALARAGVMRAPALAVVADLLAGVRDL